MEWISVEERLPEPSEELLLVMVTGKPSSKITLVDAYELALFLGEDGWCIEMWPEWETPVVHYWCSLPSPPEG